MNANPITKNDVVKYLAQVLNIDIHNPLVLEDILEDLKSIHDLNAFRIYIKENFTESKYQYLTGYQKFLALVEDFKKIYLDKLNAKIQSKSSALIEKIKLCINSYEKAVWKENKATNEFLKSQKFVNFKQHGKCIFTENELQGIDSVGDFEYWFKGDIYKLQKVLENNLRIKNKLIGKTSEHKVLENLSKRAAS